MKYFTLFFIAVILSCSKKPCPDEAFILYPQARQWVKYYDSITYEVYEDKDGLTDTMWITKETIQDTCTIDYNNHSCTGPCPMESVIISNRHGFMMTFKARGRKLIINDDASLSPANIKVWFDAVSQEPGPIPGGSACIEYGGAIPGVHYTTELLYVFSCRFCAPDPPGYKISRTSGLIEYITDCGKVWKRK